MKRKVCYFCGENASTKEHFPPKSFFPNKGSGLQLKTVPSCPRHNNGKSQVNQYVLAHITMNQGHDLNLARRRFVDSIKPQIDLDEEFKRKIADGAELLANSSVKYSVDKNLFDEFFDALSRAVLFEKFSEILPCTEYTLNHIYLSLQNIPTNADQVKLMDALKYDFFTRNKLWVDEKIHSHLDEFVYRRKIIAPCGYSASITILHSLYDCFDVVTFASNKNALSALACR